MIDELVVLVDKDDNELGVMPKDKVHHKNTPLHRAFSVFIFNDKQELLVQRRAMSKKTWPGVWSNSCCGHPLPGESREDGIVRRVAYELGISIADLKKISDYTYRFERFGVVEHEVCPVYIARTTDAVKPNPLEVVEFSWVSWEGFLAELDHDAAGKWSEWCKEEARLVNRTSDVMRFAFGLGVL